MLVILVVLWGVKVVLDHLTLPEPIKQVVLVILSVIALIVLLVSALKMIGVPVVIW